MSADPLAVHEAGEADLNVYAYVSGRALQAVDPLGLDCGPDFCGPAQASAPAGREDASSSSSWQPPVIQQFTSATAQPEKEQLKQNFSGALKAGAVSGGAAAAGYGFGVAAGNVPVAGGAASWLVAYMVDQYGPDGVKSGFGAGLAASSLPLAAQGAAEAKSGGAALATEVGAVPGGLAVAQGVATVANATANATAGMWLMGRGKAPREVWVDPKRYPEATKHLEDTKSFDRPLTVDRAGAAARRRQALSGKKSAGTGKDLDEAPPAVFKEGSQSVRAIDRGDNRGAGASIGNQLRPVKAGGKVVLKKGKPPSR